VRRTDVLFRLGGERFVVVANGVDAALRLRLAEELRQLVERTWCTAEELSLTVSVGLSEVRAGDEPAQGLRRADAALDAAKDDGRNAPAHTIARGHSRIRLRRHRRPVSGKKGAHPRWSRSRASPTSGLHFARSVRAGGPIRGCGRQ
jgi:predicted signal transduction protein with EAL and GGDEF domain